MYVCMHAAGQRGEGGTGGRSSMPPVHGPSRRLNGRRLVVIGAPSTHLAHPARRSSPTTSRHQSSVSVPCRGHIVSSSPYATGALLSSVLSLHRPPPPVIRHPSVCPAGVTSCRHHRMPREPSFRRVHIFASVLSMHRPSPPAICRFALVVPHSVPPRESTAQTYQFGGFSGAPDPRAPAPGRCKPTTTRTTTIRRARRRPPTPGSAPRSPAPGTRDAVPCL
jgi:hypothetical protein